MNARPMLHEYDQKMQDMDCEKCSDDFIIKVIFVQVLMIMVTLKQHAYVVQTIDQFWDQSEPKIYVYVACNMFYARIKMLLIYPIPIRSAVSYAFNSLIRKKNQE